MVKDEDLCVHCGLVRGAMPDGRLGHAEVMDQDSTRRGRGPMPERKSAAPRVNDFTLKFANVNGSGSASANSLIMKAIFRMGVPVVGKNFFPSNIQGLPTWYEIRVTRDGWRARSGPHRPHGRDECGDLCARREARWRRGATWSTTRPGRGRSCMSREDVQHLRRARSRSSATRTSRERAPAR